MSKEEFPNSESKGKLDRRGFLKLTIPAGIIALTSKEIGHSDISFETLENAVLDQLEEALKELIKIEKQDRSLKNSVRNLVNKYNETINLVKQVEKTEIYTRHLKSFLLWMNTNKPEGLDVQNLKQKYKNAEFTIDATHQFINNVLYSQKMTDEYNVSIKGESENFFLTDLKEIYEALHTVPNFTVKKSGFKKLTIAEAMPGARAQTDGEEMTGLFRKGDLNSYFTYHELTHFLNNKSRENGEDKEGWNMLNQGAEPYLKNSGKDFLEERIKNTGAYYENKIIPGYAESFGQEGGPDEDKATINTAILHRVNDKVLENSLIGLVKRSETDQILKRKIEFMTGYKIENGRFDTELKEKDYEDAGFPGLCYWPIWSRDEKGKTWMDREYFNAILENQKVTFREEGGQTIREISKK